MLQGLERVLAVQNHTELSGATEPLCTQRPWIEVVLTDEGDISETPVRDSLRKGEGRNSSEVAWDRCCAGEGELHAELHM